MIGLNQIKQSSFILGGAAFSGQGGGYGFGSVEFKDVERVIHSARDRHVLALDLAPIYGFTQAEKTVGLVTSKDREKYFLTSKSGVSWHSNGRVNLSNDPKLTQKMLEQSLRDL